MKLLIKQRFFTLTDTFDVMDENGNPKYIVKNEFLTFLHRLHVTDTSGNEIGSIRQNFTFFLPKFEIEVFGRTYGHISKEFSFFHPKYDIEYNGWKCEGDFMGWDYDVYSGSTQVAHISKEIFHLTDTYVIDIYNPEDEILAMMLVVAIDAANCSQNR